VPSCDAPSCIATTTELCGAPPALKGSRSIELLGESMGNLAASFNCSAIRTLSIESSSTCESTSMDKRLCLFINDIGRRFWR